MKKSVIEFAEKRLGECDKQGDYQDARYWAAYLNGARAKDREDTPLKIDLIRIIFEAFYHGYDSGYLHRKSNGEAFSEWISGLQENVFELLKKAGEAINDNH